MKKQIRMKCNKCNGTGTVYLKNTNYNLLFPEPALCQTCKRKGYVKR